MEQYKQLKQQHINKMKEALKQSIKFKKDNKWTAEGTCFIAEQIDSVQIGKKYFTFIQRETNYRIIFRLDSINDQHFGHCLGETIEALSVLENIPIEQVFLDLSHFVLDI